MAERTAAEVLAMTRRALEEQEAARQLFESDREPRPGPKTVKGIPEAEENLLRSIVSPFVPLEADVVREPQSTFETVNQLVPGGVDGEALRQVDVRTSYTPGQYANPRLASPPIVDAISSGLRFGDELLFGTPEQKEAARTTLREGIAGLPGLPQEMIKSMMRGAESIDRGGVVTRDAEGNITRPDDFFAGALGLGAGMGIGTKLSAAGAKGPVLGIFGGEKGELSGEQAKETVEMLEEQGLSPEDVWNAQAGANTKKAYRSSLDNKVRFEIPMDNVNFKSIVREVEDPDVELGKLIAAGPDGDLERLQAMQSLRIRKINDKDYVTVPGFFEFNEKELNKYGFSKYDHKREFAQFPMMQLEELIDAPQLFEEYPQLRRVRIKPTPPLAFFVQGAYNPDTKVISLDSFPNTPKGRKEMMSTLIHEIQHAVQDIEGLYGGANTGMFEPFGFGDRKKKNRDLIREQEELLEEKLKVFGFESQGQELNKRTFLHLLRRDGRPRGGKVPTDQQFSRTLAEIDDKDFRQIKRRMLAFLKSRAEEENIRADTGVDVREESRRKLNQLIKDRQEDMRSHNKSMGREVYTKEEIKNVDAEYRSQAFRYRGSDEDLIRLNNDLKEIAEKSNDPALRNMNVENITERLSKSFDEVVPALRPLIKEDKQIDEIERQASQMYQGNPGEVEARHAQLRFEGVKKGASYYEDGEMKFADRDISVEELQRTFPEETQKRVLPKEGLVFSVSEGRKTAELPGERLSMSGLPPEDPAARLVEREQFLIKSLNEDSFGTTPEEVRRNRGARERELKDTRRRIQEARDKAGYEPPTRPIQDLSLAESFLQGHGFDFYDKESGLEKPNKDHYTLENDGSIVAHNVISVSPSSGKAKFTRKTFRQPSLMDLMNYMGYAQGGAVQKYANGGMVNNMRKPVLSRGLSGLLSNYTSGPLARMSVPRGTPQGMFRGGAPGMRRVGFGGPKRIPEIDQSAITAALANLPASTPTGSRRTLDRDATEALAQGRPPPPTIPTNIAIQTPGPSPVATQEEIVPVANAAARKGRGTIYDPRFDPVVNQTVVAQEGAVPMTAAETLAAAPIATRTAATPVAQALTGSRPTDFLGFETTEGAAEMGATAPGQTPFEPGALLTEPGGITAEDIARAEQQAADQAAADQAAAEEAARLEAERLAAEEAARIAAEQEAARIQQEQLAAEQLAAQQAAEAAAAAEAQRQAELEAQRQAELEAQRQAELEAQRQAEILAQQEAERIAQEQAAQEAAAQQAAAQLAAEQLAAQEAAAQAEAQRLAEEEAARIAAEQAAQAEAQRIADEAAAEAERVRLAQIAEGERLAEEQRLAELAAQEAARQEAERLAAEELAAQEAAAQAAALAEQEAERIRQEEIAAALAQQEAAEAAERERVLAEIAERQRLEDEAAELAKQEALAAAQAEAAAAEQLAAEQLAAQQAADLAAQQNLEQQALAAEQLAAQQAAEQSALEAQIAATPDPDPVYTPPTQTEIDQAATVAQTEAGDLFTTPTDTGEVIDRGGFGTVDPVATTTTTTTDAAQADPASQQNTPAVITQASDGSFHPNPAAAAAYEQQLAAQQAARSSGLESLLTRPDFDVSQAIADYTSGYDSSRDKTFRRSFYPFQELTDEQKENAYIAEVFKPVADVSRFRPALTFGETAGTTTGTTDTTGTDTSGIPTGDVNTGAAASAPGQYGLASNQMYQCPEGYTLAFVNGRATCKSTKTAGGPGGRKDVPPEVITLGETA